MTFRWTSREWWKSAVIAESGTEKGCLSAVRERRQMQEPEKVLQKPLQIRRNKE